TSTRAGVIGSVQNYLGALVPNAGDVVIRSLTDGNVVAHTRADQFAQFLIRGVDPGVYTAQLVSDTGATLATTGAFSAGPGETVGVALTIPNSALANVAAIFANSTSSVVNSAASGGVLAVKAGEPVSPEKVKQ